MSAPGTDCQAAKTVSAPRLHHEVQEAGPPFGLAVKRPGDSTSPHAHLCHSFVGATKFLDLASGSIPSLRSRAAIGAPISFGI